MAAPTSSGRYVIAVSVAPSPAALARTDASNRSRAAPLTCSLTRTAIRTGRNGRTRTSGPPRRAIDSPAARTASDTRCGPTLTLATRAPGATTWPSNTVNTSSGSSRLTRSSAAIRTATTPATAATRSTRDWAGPRSATPGSPPGDGRGQPEPRLVLVDLARIRAQHGDRRPGRGAGDRDEIGLAQPPALRPADAADREVAREHGPHEAGGRAAARDDPLEPHPRFRSPVAQPSRASAASIARRVYTTAIAARYSALAWMSELTVRPPTTFAAAAATASADPSVPTSASSTSVAR